MNLSGEVVKKYIDYYKIGINDIYVIQDDLDMDIGKIAYIGSTKNIGRRKANRKYGTGVPFDKIYKENPDKFELFIIGKYESIDKAREEEVKYIKLLKPLYNRNHNH